MFSRLTAAFFATAIAIPATAALTCAIAPSLWAIAAGGLMLMLIGD